MDKKDFLDDLNKLCNSDITFLPNIESKKKKEEPKEETTVEQKTTEHVDVEKPKKKKKKKSMMDELHLYDDNLNVITSEDIDIDENDPDTTLFANGKTIAEMIEYQLENMDQAYSDDIILNERKRYKQKGKDDFEDDFSQVLALLYDNLKKSEKLDRDLDKLVSPALSSRTRQMSKYVVDLISAKISNNSNSLSIIKEISATRKKIADLRIAESKTKPADYGENNPDLIANAFFDKISSFGRNNFMDMVGRNSVNEVEFEPMNDDYTSSDNSSIPDYDVESILAQRETGRSESDELRIKYEKLNPKIVIIRDIEEGTWEFAALDKDGNMIEDYPVPDKERIGRVSFSHDGSSASDDQGKTYRVYQYEDQDDDDDYFHDYDELDD